MPAPRHGECQETLSFASPNDSSGKEAGRQSHHLEEGRVHCDWIVPKAEDTKGGGKKKEEVEQVDVNVECEYRHEGVLQKIKVKDEVSGHNHKR